MAEKKSYKELLSILYFSLGKDKIKFIISIILMIIGTFSLSYAPEVAGEITDVFANYASNVSAFDVVVIVDLLLTLLGLYAFGNLLEMISARIMAFVSSNVTMDLRNQVHDKINKLPLSYIDDSSTGDIIARLTDDMNAAEVMINDTVSNVIAQFVVVFSIVIIMLVLDIRLSLIYLILVPVSFGLLKFITSSTRRNFMNQQELVGELNGFIGDVFNNHKIVKSYGMEDKSIETFDEINERISKSYFKSRFFSGFIIPLNTIITNLGYLAMSVFGGYLIIQGQLTVGGFLTFILYGQMLSHPLTTIGNELNLLQAGFTSLERIVAFLGEEEEKVDETAEEMDINETKGEIRFDHVKFGYSEDKTLMSDVTLETKPGMTMAIVGPSGAGKTTIVNLLMRFYDIDDGAIYLDGKNIYNIEKHNFRKNFGMVLQDSWIFEGTIAENIGYGMENPTMEDIERASKMVGCDKFIDLLPNGYDTIISDENTTISVGEKQLLVLARTVISNPKILILDEATSQMDTRTELMVTQAMEKMMEGRTTFIIAHRLFTIKNADKIIFMEEGDIKEVGNHDELLKLNGLYAEMYKDGSI